MDCGWRSAAECAMDEGLCYEQSAVITFTGVFAIGGVGPQVVYAILGIALGQSMSAAQLVYANWKAFVEGQQSLVNNKCPIP